MSKKAQQKHIERTYEIGYGRPPSQGQFQKGKSGNLKGQAEEGNDRQGSGKGSIGRPESRSFLAARCAPG